MKTLCREAGVMPEKVFPHNLRHLFAKCFYEQEKDLAHLRTFWAIPLLRQPGFMWQ